MILSFSCSLLVCWLLLYYELGLGAFLSVQLVLVVFGYNMRKQGLVDREWWLKAAYIFALSLVFILRDMLVFKVLTFLSLPFLFGFLYVHLTELDVRILLPSWLISVFRPIQELHLLVRHASEKVLKGRDEVKHIALGILIAAIFLAFVLPWLMASDLVVEALAKDFLAKIRFDVSTAFRIVFVLVLSSYLYAQGSKKMVSWFPKKKGAKPADADKPEKRSSKELVVNTFLVIVNLVYGLFVYVQVRYLFFHADVLPAGISYAEYARVGFFQLLMVAIINVVLVAFLEFMNKNKNRRQRILENCTLAMTFMVAVSSFYRMHLYESYYGYTNMRMLVFMFLIFLMGLILHLIAYIFSYKKFVVQSLVVFVLIYYLGSSLFNVDGFVASQNIERYVETGQIHIYYLTHLSEDARAVAEPFLDEHEELYAEQYIDTYDSRDGYEGRIYSEEWRSQTNWTKGDDYPWQAWNRMKKY